MVEHKSQFMSQIPLARFQQTFMDPSLQGSSLSTFSKAYHPQPLLNLECQPHHLSGLLGEVPSGVEVFTKEAHFPFDLAVNNRAAVAGDHPHVGLDGCGPVVTSRCFWLPCLKPSTRVRTISRSGASAAARSPLRYTCWNLPVLPTS